jgi:hypothetical protein
MQEIYCGLLFGAIYLRPDVKLDIDQLAAQKAMARTNNAIDILHRKSLETSSTNTGRSYGVNKRTKKEVRHT